jgi:hypothetical protein
MKNDGGITVNQTQIYQLLYFRGLFEKYLRKEDNIQRE